MGDFSRWYWPPLYRLLCDCSGYPHWNKNALVTTNVTTNFSRVLLIYMYLVHRPIGGDEKNSTLLLRKIAA